MLQDIYDCRILSAPSYLLSLSIETGARLLKTKNTYSLSSSPQNLYDETEEQNDRYLKEDWRLMARIGMYVDSYMNQRTFIYENQTM